MAGESQVSPEELAKLKGLSKYFNSVTNEGRANVAKATYLGIAIVGLYFYFKPSKKKEAAQ